MTTPAKSFSKLAKEAVIPFFETVGIPVGRHQSEEAARKAEEEALAPLDPQFRAPLLSMFRGEDQLGSDGQSHALQKAVKISPSQGRWLYDFCVSVRPQTTIEIGMAYGFSTLFFLAAIAKNGAGHHTSIDPFQTVYWDGIGLTHAQTLAAAKGLTSAFAIIEDRSDRAAIDLARAGSTFDLIFIDGNHRFDDVLVDFYLFAPLCSIGGHIVLDDMWMSSIQSVVAYVRANRTDFVEVPTEEKNISVFRKVSEDNREWNHFRKFAVSSSTN